jgi:hypothetical protein
VRCVFNSSVVPLSQRFQGVRDVSNETSTRLDRFRSRNDARRLRQRQ